MVRNILVLVLILFLQLKNTHAQLIQVELYNQFNVKTLVVVPIEGKYNLLTEKGKIYKIKKNNIVYFTQVGDSISIWDSDQHIGKFATAKFIGTGKTNILKVESVYPALKERKYEGDLFLEAENNALLIKNLVNIDSYLAGVVEAEAGPNAPYEFYKTQAIISRTYLYEHINREGSSYKIGDDVNFQVYKGMSVQNPSIKQAVIHTRGLVIVDSLNQLITAVFHSNSGGATANSEDVWLTSRSYLKQTEDPFSLNQRNSQWRDSVKIEEWLNYFAEQGFDIHLDSCKQDVTNIQQNSRIKYLKVDNDTLHYKQVRSRFKLRSAWFSAKLNGEFVVLEGRGYGHGVGLSQEGAMQMARQNYSFLDIINYYYQNVTVIHISKAG